MTLQSVATLYVDCNAQAAASSNKKCMTPMKTGVLHSYRKSANVCSPIVIFSVNDLIILCHYISQSNSRFCSKRLAALTKST